ncbi:MAG: type II toxin-antitoxin system VapC family toxin [Pseudolysinimonas sp.]|uniref:PIN domain-containing protein n=1 Tax=Pseudolysinimonas sp. TaxID=2680009 RepID=UPI003C73BC8F
MIGVDTNVLLRYLLDDDPRQSPQAAAFFEARSEKDPAFVSLVAVVEAVWTLRARERMSSDRVAQALRALLSAREIVVQAPELVRRAIRDSEEHGTDLADAVIAGLGIDADYTVTFDKKAGALAGMQELA